VLKKPKKTNEMKKGKKKKMVRPKCMLPPMLKLVNFDIPRPGTNLAKAWN
jgi:hypothetical protein